MKILVSLSASGQSLYGPKFSDSPLSVYTKRKSEAIAVHTFNGEGKAKDIGKVTVTLKNPASVEDVEKVAKTVKGLDPSTADLTGQRVANEPKLVAALKKKGFDGFSDVVVFTDEDFLQVIPFSSEAVKAQ